MELNANNIGEMDLINFSTAALSAQ